MREIRIKISIWSDLQELGDVVEEAEEDDRDEVEPDPPPASHSWLDGVADTKISLHTKIIFISKDHSFVTFIPL